MTSRTVSLSSQKPSRPCLSLLRYRRRGHRLRRQRLGRVRTHPLASEQRGRGALRVRPARGERRRYQARDDRGPQAPARGLLRLPHDGIAINEASAGTAPSSTRTRVRSAARASCRAARVAVPRRPIGALVESQESRSAGRKTRSRGGVAINDDSRNLCRGWATRDANDRAGKLTNCATLQEALLAWHALASAQKIRVSAGPPRVMDGCGEQIKSGRRRPRLAR
jgi:hypothetical protein